MPSKLSEKLARNKRLKRQLLHALSIAISALIAIAIAVFFHFIPFRSLLSGLPIPARGQDEMRVHFLSVGEGDCTIVEFPEGDALVVDGGNGSFQNTEHLVRYLKGLGSPRLTLIATHTDCDHAAGLSELFDMFEVDKLYLPVGGSELGHYMRLLRNAKEAGVETEPLTRYRTISRPSGAYAACISPRSTDGETESDNDASTVLYIGYRGVNFLLAADITSARERLLMREYALDESIFDCGDCRVRLDEVDVLRVSHHGSATSSAAEWLALLDAEIAIISSGADNRYGHPASETLTRLAAFTDAVYRTDECGDIYITVKDGYTVHTATE